MTPLVDYPEFKDIIAEEITVKSHDGEHVPLTLVYHKNLKKNGQAPTIIYGYGAFGEIKVQNILLRLFSQEYMIRELHLGNQQSLQPK